MYIIAIKYQKEKNGKWYAGLKIEGSDVTTYLNDKGYNIESIYSAIDCNITLSINVEPILEYIKVNNEIS